jgi:hypothetical protein
MIGRGAVFGVAVWAGAAAAESGPPPEFYTGLYRMIGTEAAGSVDQPVRLDAAGAGLAVSVCGGAAGETLMLPKGTEEDPYISGRIGGREVICEGFWTFENYPLLACYREDGARLTLWPSGDFGAALACAD